MDFSNRAASGSQPQVTHSENKGENKTRSSRLPDGMSKGLRIASVLLLFSVTVLIIAVALSFVFGNPSDSKYLQKNTFQAVDISGGSTNGDQIYFGNIKTLNDKYLVLNNVYYIPSNSSSSSITLEPLVCQVDVPFNQMIVNRSSVNWWENLQSSGQVSKAITNYQKSNPNGPSCPKASPSTSSTGTTSPASSTTPSSSKSSTSTSTSK